MSQIRYAFLDIKRNFGRYLLFTVEIVISFVLITIAIMSLFHMSANRKIYEETLGDRPMYLLKDLTSPEKLRHMRESEGITDRMADFYDFLSTQHEDYTVGRLDEEIPKDSRLAAAFGLSGRMQKAKVLMVSSSFFDFYQLHLAEGERFAPEAYRTVDAAYTPVILGIDFKEDFSIGDHFRTEADDYVVIGFLDEDSVYYRLERSPDVYSLDKTILTPLNTAQYRKDKDFDRLHQAITGTYIESNDPEEMRAIIDKSSELGLYDLAYQTFEDQMNYILEKFNLHLQLLVFLIRGTQKSD